MFWYFSKNKNKFIAAGDTTATCMQNICLTLAKNPEIQKKAYEELQEKNFHTEGTVRTHFTKRMF